MKFRDEFTDDIECSILHSIMQGKDNWWKHIKEGGDCLTNCPYYAKCNGSGPKGILCSSEWADAELNIRNLEIVQHILNNFEYYNKDDIKEINENSTVLGNLREHLNSEIINWIINSPDNTKTDSKGTTKYRLGQNKFRIKLQKYWGECAVTGFYNDALLCASHIKPWEKSTSKERLDVYNGLLLSPLLDALFDKGFITFTDTNKILISPKLSDKDIEILKLSKDWKLSKIENEHKVYLDYHRKHIFIDKS